jgi:hypothetical protein
MQEFAMTAINYIISNTTHVILHARKQMEMRVIPHQNSIKSC